MAETKQLPALVAGRERPLKPWQLPSKPSPPSSTQQGAAPATATAPPAPATAVSKPLKPKKLPEPQTSFTNLIVQWIKRRFQRQIGPLPTLPSSSSSHSSWMRFFRFLILSFGISFALLVMAKLVRWYFQNLEEQRLRETHIQELQQIISLLEEERRIWLDREKRFKILIEFRLSRFKLSIDPRWRRVYEDFASEKQNLKEGHFTENEAMMLLVFDGLENSLLQLDDKDNSREQSHHDELMTRIRSVPNLAVQNLSSAAAAAVGSSPSTVQFR
eukprot:GILK01014955.1.p1 GENE.GILK01014955.1~~GILK01014955.1.p1  ORF type:complete len:286 (-),score=36.71 GILK01014955.1:57-875(-)